MVYLLSTLLLSVAALTSLASGLELGEYSRPTGDDVSGFVNATTPFVRSPCPALNTLANHGYLPRDGKNITPDVFREAIMTRFGLSDAAAGRFVDRLPKMVSLSDLSQHNFIEHDASLSKFASSSGRDPSEVDQVGVQLMLELAVDGQLDTKGLGEVRRVRKKQCNELPQWCDLDALHEDIAFSETATTLRCLGGHNNESISVEHIQSFFGEERFPEHFEAPKTEVTVEGLDSTKATVFINSLVEGDYFRPTGDNVSGFVNATTKYVRSPCPALNSLTNHGYLPRDGKNITGEMYRDAIMTHFSLSDAAAGRFVDALPTVTALSDLSKHNFIEHDASLAHFASSSGRDPAKVDQAGVKLMIDLAVNGQVGAKQLGRVRNIRKQECEAQPQGCDLDELHENIAFSETATTLRCLGGNNNESISVEFIQSFFLEERIPANYEAPKTEVTVRGLDSTQANVLMYSLAGSCK